ncbi:MAG TPA: hypothetical protein VN193_07175 [Candidatus Angelobacter sp.]|jgi:hypothetical protein|nr:hypothetical protein [Candidatus Angelobacter sp.]
MACFCAVAATPRLAVYLEQGPKRTFACALDWPGWCRVARGDEAALEMLVDYAGRYAKVVSRAGLTLPAVALADLDVVARVPGTLTTDFGAPDVAAPSDTVPVGAAEAKRMAALLDAAWAELDGVVAHSPASLRKGPRGGGRDRDAMVAHVANAERSYARKLDVRMTAEEWRAGGVEELRSRILTAVSRPSHGGPVRERGWPVRYMVRRMAWHVLDHAWEMEDRAA